MHISGTGRPKILQTVQRSTYRHGYANLKVNTKYLDKLYNINFRVGGTQNKTNIISILSAIISPPELIQVPL